MFARMCVALNPSGNAAGLSDYGVLGQNTPLKSAGMSKIQNFGDFVGFESVVKSAKPGYLLVTFRLISIFAKKSGEKWLILTDLTSSGGQKSDGFEFYQIQRNKRKKSSQFDCFEQKIIKNSVKNPTSNMIKKLIKIGQNSAHSEGFFC